jgi:hypothetical protein
MRKASLLVWLALSAFVLNASSASNPFVTFSDPVMNFTFSYPDDFQSLPSAQPLLNQAAGCITIPLRLKGKSERPYERILINEIDYDYLSTKCARHRIAKKGTENDLMNVYGHLEMSEPSNFLLDGHPAAFITAKAEVGSPMKGLEPGMILYGVQTCVLLDHRVACWNVLSSDHTRLPRPSRDVPVRRGHPHTEVAKFYLVALSGNRH